MEQELAAFFREGRTGFGRKSWRCPNETQIAAYVDNQLALGQHQHLEAHLAECQFCRSQVTSLARLQDAPAPVEGLETLVPLARELATKEAGRAIAAPWRWAPAAALAVCLVLGAGLLLRQPKLGLSPPKSPTVLSATVTSQATPAAPAAAPSARNAAGNLALPQLVFPREDSVLAREEVEFRWKAVPNSLYYDLRVVTAEGDLVWEGTAERNYARPPGEVGLQAGQQYFIWVRAYLPHGKTVQSKAVAFTVRKHT
jgi:hypothetical protein